MAIYESPAIAPDGYREVELLPQQTGLRGPRYTYVKKEVVDRGHPFLCINYFQVHDLQVLYNLAQCAYTYPLSSTNYCMHCISIYAFIDESGYALTRLATNSLFRLSHFLEASRKNALIFLTSCGIHDFMQRHHFVTVRARIFKSRHEKSSAWTGG